MSQFPHVGTPAATHRGHIRCGGAAYRPPHPTRVILVLAAFAGSAWLVSCGDSAVGPAPPPPPPPNRAPVPAGSIPAQTVAVAETAAVDVSAYFSDPDGDALSYTAETSDAGVAEVSVSGSTVTVSAVGRGSATVTVTATDPGGLTATQTLEAIVPNRAPEPAGSIPAQTVAVGETAVVDVSAYFTDADGDALSYTAETSDAGVAEVSVSGSTVTVSAVGRGSATVTVTATDPGGLTATQTLEAIVPNRGPEPAGSIPAQTVAVGETAVVDVSAYFTDADGDALSYTAETSDAGVAEVSVSGSTVTVSAVGRGSATVTVTATDPGGLTATQTLEAIVPNRAPEPAGSIPAQTVAVGETAVVDVSAYFTDTDGDALSYTAETSDAGVAEVSVSGSTVTVSAVGRGSATVTVTATDPGGLTATQTLEAIVPNRAPEPAGSIPAQTVAVGETAVVDVSAYFTDADGDALSYAASSSNPSVAVVSTSGATVMITAVAKGSVTVTVTATDPGGLTATQTLEATVPNRAPEARGSLPDQTVQAGQTATLDVSPYFTDADGDALSYAAATSSSSVSTASVSGAVVTIQGVAVGETTLTVTARDPDGGGATQQVSVTVTPPAPDLAFAGVSPASATLTPGRSVTFTFRIRNQGTLASSATTIRAMRSPNPIVSTRDTELESYSLSSLAASQDLTFPLTISVDASTAAGTIYIGMCIDAVTDESNTRNNCSEGARLTITASSSGQQPSGSVSAGDGSAIRIRASHPRIEASRGDL